MDKLTNQNASENTLDTAQESLSANDVDFNAPSIAPPAFQLKTSDGFQEEEAMETGMEQENGGFTGVQPPEDPAAIQAKMGTGNPIQRTTFKMASEGPEFHRTDPEKFTHRTGDELEAKSLHQYRVGSNVMRLATSPITIFMHGNTLANYTAARFHKYLVDRGYAPQQGGKIVFITCKAAQQMDEFMLSKGQALADALQAEVHLAKGVVRINADGVPVVTKPNGVGTYPIQSQEELARIVPKNAEGWKTYRPGVTYKELAKEISRARTELKSYRKFKLAKADAEDFLEQVEDTRELLKTDRRGMRGHLAEIRSFRRGIRENYGPRLELHGKINNLIGKLEIMKMETRGHVGRINDLIAEYEGWMHGLEEDTDESNARLEGYQLLFKDKLKDWIAPLEAEIAQEKSGGEVKGKSGWEDDDDWLAELGISDSEEAIAEEEETGGTESKGNSKNKKQGKKAGAVVQAKMASESSAPVQRQVIDKGGRLANGKTLEDLMNELPNMDLVRGNNNLDLVIRFTSMDDYGYTTVTANGTRIAHHEINHANRNKKFQIIIHLNREAYNSGQSMASMGSLIETLTHEWMLHGQQHAVNINSTRHGVAPDAHIDHDRLFEESMTSMDIAIALQMGRKENAAIANDILISYMKDVQAHTRVMARPWTGNMPKSKELQNRLKDLNAIHLANDSFAVQKPNLASKLEDLMEDLSFYVDDPYELEYLADFDCDDVKAQLSAIAAIDITGLNGPVMALPGAIRNLRAIIDELAFVKKISAKGFDALGPRRKALETLGINPRALDMKFGEMKGADKGTDFKAVRKKRD